LRVSKRSQQDSQNALQIIFRLFAAIS